MNKLLVKLSTIFIYSKAENEAHNPENVVSNPRNWNSNARNECDFS